MSNKMKLYKFRSLASCEDFCRVKEIIETGKFHCSNFFEFNDMNEGVYTAQQTHKNMPTLELGQKLEYKICSFSGEESLEKQLMWGHYANAGMGVVIEIETNADIEIMTNTNIDLYGEEEALKGAIYKIDYNEYNKELKFMQEILTRKTTEWEYENEFRYIEKTTEEKINIGKITKIYFGKPYEHLGNFPEIKEKHKKLKEYLKYREKLKDFCKCEDSPKIECKNYPFK